MGIQAVHGFGAEIPYVSASEMVLGDPRDAPWFRIGMPHLDGRGLSMSWLLREAGHRHWCAVAEHVGQSANGIHDLDGNKVLAGVLAVVTTGRADAFREDDVAELKLVRRPTPLNGWRSVTELRSTGGAVVSVELVTGFAIRAGTSNHALAPARMRDDLVAERGTMTSGRTDELRRKGSLGRRETRTDGTPPILSVRISPRLHFNGMGLVCFAGLHDHFVSVEEILPEAVSPHAPAARRRIHHFGNLDAGEMLDVSTRHDHRLSAGRPSLVVTSHARRRTDGAVVAVCESVYER